MAEAGYKAPDDAFARSTMAAFGINRLYSRMSAAPNPSEVEILHNTEKAITGDYT